MKTYRNLFPKIIAPENLFAAWGVFRSDKRNKSDVAEFERHLEKNIFQLYRDLRDKRYRHGPYTGFFIRDPKQRHIHKAIVRDRVLHHAIFSVINPIFEEMFIPTSFSCRVGFGTHKGVETLERKARKVAQNGTRDCFVLKCDIRRFFDTVDHNTLLSILGKRIKDDDTMSLLRSIIESYEAAPVRERERERVNAGREKGIPIGNLTSQLFANVYMNEFDQFVKHVLKVRYYARYTDDFVIVSHDRDYLINLLPQIEAFLKTRLSAELHPKKVVIRKLGHGIDFLGYVILPRYRLVRTKTRKRIFKKFKTVIAQYCSGAISEKRLEASLHSYLGVFSHANARRLAEELKNLVWLSE